MPDSPARRKTARGRSLDRRLRAEVKAAKAAKLSRSGRLKRRLGWPVCGIGVVWFVATYVANFAGVVLLPFDRHHLFGQVGGLLLAVVGLVWATT